MRSIRLTGPDWSSLAKLLIVIDVVGVHPVMALDQAYVQILDHHIAARCGNARSLPSARWYRLLQQIEELAAAEVRKHSPTEGWVHAHARKTLNSAAAFLAAEAHAFESCADRCDLNSGGDRSIARGTTELDVLTTTTTTYVLSISWLLQEYSEGTRWETLLGVEDSADVVEEAFLRHELIGLADEADISACDDSRPLAVSVAPSMSRPALAIDFGASASSLMGQPGVLEARARHAAAVVVVIATPVPHPLNARFVAELRLAAEHSRSTSRHVGDEVTVVVTTGWAKEALVVLPLAPARGAAEPAKRDALIGENIRRIDSTVRGISARRGMHLLDRVANAVDATSPGRLLVLVGAAPRRTESDVREVGWSGDPDEIAASLCERGLVPDLTGWEVVFTGLGQSARSLDPSAADSQHDLAAYWAAICRAAGADSFDVDDTPGMTAPPGTTRVPEIERLPRGGAERPVRGPQGVSHRSRRDLHPNFPRTVSRALVIAAATVIAIATVIAVTVSRPLFLPPASPPTGPTITVLVDGTANEPMPSLSPYSQELLTGAGHAGGSVNVMSTDGDTSLQIPLTPWRTGGSIEHGPSAHSWIEQDPSADELIQHQVAEVATAVGSITSTQSDTDVLQALAIAARVARTPGTLLVVDSGLNTKGAFDLRQIGWSADPQEVVWQLRSSDALPNLAGWNVVWNGLGTVAGPQPSLPAALPSTLAAYWSAILVASGASQVDVAPQHLDALWPVANVSAPVVPVPQLTVADTAASTRTVVPDALLGFRPGSAVISADSSDLLSSITLRVRTQLATRPHAAITITGYAADPPGTTPAVAESVSLARAQAVADALGRFGVTNPVNVRGGGVAPGVTAMVGGKFDGAVADQMRRVEISY